jgi:hypothetical protein
LLQTRSRWRALLGSAKLRAVNAGTGTGAADKPHEHGARQAGDHVVLSRHTPSGAASIPPEVLEPVRRPRRVDGRAGDRAMSEPALDRPGVVPLVGQRVAAGMAQHVGMEAAGMTNPVFAFWGFRDRIEDAASVKYDRTARVDYEVLTIEERDLALSETVRTR